MFSRRNKEYIHLIHLLSRAIDIDREYFFDGAHYFVENIYDYFDPTWADLFVYQTCIKEKYKINIFTKWKLDVS